MAESTEEVAVLVQRVVKDINNAFKRNPHMALLRDSGIDGEPPGPSRPARPSPSFDQGGTLRLEGKGLGHGRVEVVSPEGPFEPGSSRRSRPRVLLSLTDEETEAQRGRMTGQPKVTAAGPLKLRFSGFKPRLF